MEGNSSAPRRFRLPVLAWLAAGVCAFAPLSGAVKLAFAGELTPYRLGAALLIAAGFVVIPLAVAWLASRLVKSRPAAATPAFVVTLVALAGLAVSRVVRETHSRDDELARQTRELATQLVRREATGSSDSAPASSALPAPTTRLGQAIAEAQRAVKSRLDAVQLAYDAAADELDPRAFFDLASLDTPHAIAVRRRQVEAFNRANELLLEAADLGAYYFSTELRGRNVPEDAVREAVALYRTATKNHLPRVKQLRDTDGALVLLMNQFLDFAESHLNAWHRSAETGALAFDDPAAKTRHDELLRTARVLETERAQKRRALLNAAPNSKPRTPN